MFVFVDEQIDFSDWLASLRSNCFEMNWTCSHEWLKRKKFTNNLVCWEMINSNRYKTFTIGVKKYFWFSKRKNYQKNLMCACVFKHFHLNKFALLEVGAWNEFMKFTTYTYSNGNYLYWHFSLRSFQWN